MFAACPACSPEEAFATTYEQCGFEIAPDTPCAATGEPTICQADATEARLAA